MGPRWRVKVHLGQQSISSACYVPVEITCCNQGRRKSKLNAALVEHESIRSKKSSRRLMCFPEVCVGAREIHRIDLAIQVSEVGFLPSCEGKLIKISHELELRVDKEVCLR